MVKLSPVPISTSTDKFEPSSCRCLMPRDCVWARESCDTSLAMSKMSIELAVESVASDKA